MDFLRPFAGMLVVAAALGASPVLADRVDIITPGLTASAPANEVKAEALSPQAPVQDSSSDSSPDVETQPTLQTKHFGAQASLSCRVAKGAVDLVVVNDGAETLPAGTRIKWQLKHARTRGYFAIIGELTGGETLVADDVLDGRADPGDTCVARAI